MAETEKDADNQSARGPEPSPQAVRMVPAMGAGTGPALTISIGWNQLLYLATTMATAYFQHQAAMADIKAREKELRYR